MTAPQPSFAKIIFTIIAVATMVLFARPATAAGVDALPSVTPSSDEGCDRLWLVSTRHLTNDVCRANLSDPSFQVSKLDQCGNCCRSSIDELRSAITPDRATVVYVHGNRTPADVAIERGITIYHFIARHRCDHPIDWVIWSWPSEKQGILVQDAREKAVRTDAHGMYLALFMRDNFIASVPTAMIGYSFGGRVITGSLHALAGGSLGGRSLPGQTVSGARIRAGLVAPAVENSWLLPSGYHGKATQNLDELALMYNHRDSVLKRYWLLDRVRSSVALGYSGPSAFGPRFDGSRLPVVARDFAQVIGHNHDELVYYQKDCRASSEMARLINGTRPSQLHSASESQLIR